MVNSSNGQNEDQNLNHPNYKTNLNNLEDISFHGVKAQNFFKHIHPHLIQHIALSPPSTTNLPPTSPSSHHLHNK